MGRCLVIFPSIRVLILGSLGLLLPAAAAAQAQPQPPGAPWALPHFSADPKALYEAASAVTAPEGANVAVLDDDESYTFDDAGRMVYVGRFIYKVLNQKGAEGWDSLSVGWHPWHEARPVIRARVIAPDFTVRTLDPATINEAPARGGDYKIYSDDKVLRAPLPAIAPGAVVEEEYTVSETEPLFPAGRAGWNSFGVIRAPVAHSRVTFDAPASLPLRTSTLLLNDMKPVRTEANGRVTLVYDLPPLEGFEPIEPYLPRDLPHLPEIQFSTGASWQKLASDYAALVDSKANAAAVRPIVEKLIAGKESPAEKEAAILDYLDREVRYTGIEFGEGSIIPRDPADTLSKKYGDCKDKATLLVAMLRAAKIQAYVALLNAGARMDVPENLPGMGLFDHAIVYVPGKSPLWIDATDRYARLGQLPSGDQGRLALIARGETTALVKIPQSSASENRLVEYRELTLSDDGPAAVTERIQPQGVYESRYRAYYADKPDKDTRDGLRGYVRSEYVSEDLLKVDRTDPADLSQQFELTIQCDKARRGYTGLDAAQAAIRLDSLFTLLPEELRRKDDTEEKQKEEGKDKPAKPRTADWEMNQAFTEEWQYKIVPPPGYIPRGLPQNATIQLGPALLTEDFSTGENGAVVVHLVFDSVKSRYTVAEATQLRNKVADLIAGPAILVNFQPEGEALLQQGKTKEALASFRALAAQHPDKAVYHLQVANVLLDAGMGEAARQEARQAVKLDPKSALAEKTLAQILKHDLLGRSMRPGYDPDGAAQAFRAAIALDPDDHSTQGDLAILLEYDPVGRRYSSQSKMKEAIAEYRKLTEDQLEDLDLTNNLAFAEFYGGDFAGACKSAQTLNPIPKALLAACTAMLQGSKAGLAEANKRATGEDDYKDTALTAGKMLMRIRQYPQAADFLEAGASGDDAAWAMGLAQVLRKAKHHEEIQFADTPGDLAMRFWLAIHDPGLTQDKFEALLSRNARTVLKNEDPDSLKRTLDNGKVWNSVLARDDNSLDVEVDVDLQEADPKGEGNDATGYREKLAISGSSDPPTFIVKEDNAYKVLATAAVPDAIGLEVLDRIGKGDLNGAKVLLDWLREDIHMEGGDDPLGGPVFPRFWMQGEAADARKMKLAAAVILAGSKSTVAQGVTLLEPALKSPQNDREKTNLELALMVSYSIQDDYKNMLAVSAPLLQEYPESRIAFIENARALMGLGRMDDAQALAAQRLKLLDGDPDALSMIMEIAADRGDYAAADATAQKLVDQNKETANALNAIAWYALFRGNVTDSDISAATQAVQAAKDNPGILHTLACLYAEVGRTTEARDLVLRAMDEWELDEPNDDVWYVFGRIAEQYGERDIAIADYRKLQKPKEPLEIPTSTYRLAQMRLKLLGASTAGGE